MAWCQLKALSKAKTLTAADKMILINRNDIKICGMITNINSNDDDDDDDIDSGFFFFFSRKKFKETIERDLRHINMRDIFI